MLAAVANHAIDGRLIGIAFDLFSLSFRDAFRFYFSGIFFHQFPQKLLKNQFFSIFQGIFQKDYSRNKEEKGSPVLQGIVQALGQKV